MASPRCATASADGLASLTRSGAVLGTPAYMPLEQLTGAEVDARADVYALAVVFYEVLTQKLPFAARTASELAVLQATTLPERISVHRPELAGEPELVLMRALARKPGDRFQDVAAFAEALAKASSKHLSRFGDGQGDVHEDGAIDKNNVTKVKDSQFGFFFSVKFKAGNLPSPNSACTADCKIKGVCSSHYIAPPTLWRYTGAGNVYGMFCDSTVN